MSSAGIRVTWRHAPAAAMWQKGPARRGVRLQFGPRSIAFMFLTPFLGRLRSWGNGPRRLHRAHDMYCRAIGATLTMSCCAVLCCGLQVRYGTMRENVMAMEVCRQGECMLMHAHACSLGPPGSPKGIETTALVLNARAVPAFPVYSCWWPLMSMHSGLRGVSMQ